MKKNTIEFMKKLGEIKDFLTENAMKSPSEMKEEYESNGKIVIETQSDGPNAREYDITIQKNEYNNFLVDISWPQDGIDCSYIEFLPEYSEQIACAILIVSAAITESTMFIDMREKE